MSNNLIRPQSLIFTLFGDYIRHRGDRIWIGSLIKLLGQFGVSEQAVRTTVSRMTRRGWLKIERVANISYYVLTPKARKLIEEGAARIFHFNGAPEQWNECWQLVTYSIPEDMREARDRFRRELNWLGYGTLANAIWVSPHNQQTRVQELVESLKLKPYVQLFSAQLEGFISCAELIARCWNVKEINAAYARFIEKHAPQLHECQRCIAAAQPMDDAECFARRFTLIHEYRRFPYLDPRLPVELLPREWRGAEATALFQQYHQLLADGANRYFESVFR